MELEGWRARKGGQTVMGERETRWRHRTKEEMLRRNTDKKPGCQALVVAGQGWGLEMQKQGDKQSPESSITISSPLLPTLYPQPKQDAVSMTTWPSERRAGDCRGNFPHQQEDRRM